MQISVVIPVYNGEKSIGQLVAKLEEELDQHEFEVVLVNDASRDNSEEVCRKIAESTPNVNFISLRKNFGEFNAVMCGLNHIHGDFAVIIDDDFQNPPSEILKLVAKAKEGNFDVVYSYYAEKKHSMFRNVGSWAVNYLTSYLLHKPKDLYLSSFKLIRRDLVEEIIKFKTPYPYIDGFIFQLTNRIGKVEVIHQKREHGESNYTLRKLASLFLTIIFGYSMIPLRLTFFAGIFSIFFAIVYMLLYFFNFISEWGSPVVIFLCGVQLTAIALIGEYIGKAFMLQSGVPQFVIKEKLIKNVD